ncbi:MAG: CRTAC1 family protein [Deltaproteobacteria bacterium]|nr:CRTAC1 family protein [Deltaproteobacteria bacterium]
MLKPLHLALPLACARALACVSEPQPTDPTPEPADAPPSDLPFEDVRSSAGLDGVPTLSGGVVADDFDGDGILDVLITDWRDPVVYLGHGDLTFSASPQWSEGLPGAVDVWAASSADFDNDGDPDLFLGTGETDRVLRNDGDGFVDITEASGLPDTRGITMSGAFADYDGDGFLDLYITGHAAIIPGEPPQFGVDTLLRGRGDGTFEDVSSLIPLDLRTGRGFGARWSDLDHDGDADLYVVNEQGMPGAPPNRAFRNDGPDGTGGHLFTDWAEECSCGVGLAGMGLAIGDVDRDGWQDLYMSNSFLPDTTGEGSRLGQGEVLLRATGGGAYVDASLALGAQPSLDDPEERTISWGLEFLDVQNDGWLDCFLVYGPLKTAPMVPQPNGLVLGGPAGFSLSPNSGADDYADGRGVVIADFDGDGCEDLIVANRFETPGVFRNRCRDGGSWIEFELEGTQSNRDAIGAVITITSGGDGWRAEVPGANVLGSNPRRVHVGLGDVQNVDVTVQWPSGATSTITEVPVNQRLAVVE